MARDQGPPNDRSTGQAQSTAAYRPGGQDGADTDGRHREQPPDAVARAPRRTGALVAGPRIIVGYDGSDAAADALALARRLAAPLSADLLLAAAFAYGPLPIGVDAYQKALLQDAAAVFAKVAPDPGAPKAQTRALGGASPAHLLHDLAVEEDASMIVLGSTHRGPIGRIMPGSVAERLLQGGPCAVAIAPRGFAASEPGELRVIAVGFDASPESRAALATAAALAAAAGATLRVFAALAPMPLAAAAVAAYPNTERQDRAWLDERLRAAIAELPPELRTQYELLPGNPAQVLAAKAEEGVDLLVVGSRGYGPLRRVLLGGTSAELTRTAPCPLLVVPRGAAEDLSPDDEGGIELGANTPG